MSTNVQSWSLQKWPSRANMPFTAMKYLETFSRTKAIKLKENEIFGNTKSWDVTSQTGSKNCLARTTNF